jgi:hypothetical protein
LSKKKNVILDELGQLDWLVMMMMMMMMVGWLVGYILRPWLTAEAVTHHPRLGQRPPGGKPWVSLTSCWF